MDDLLQQGITAYKAGKRDEARKIFIANVKQNPDSERAWGWMYNLSDNNKERIYCLTQILRINPKNEKANQLLEKLGGFTSPLEQPSPHPANLDTQETAVKKPPFVHGKPSASINDGKKSPNNKLIWAIGGGVGVICLCLIAISVSILSPKSRAVPTVGAIAPQNTAMVETQQVSYTQTAQVIPTLTYTPIPQPTNTLAPALTVTVQVALPASVASCLPQNTPRETALVVGIIDGDTIDVQINEQIYRLRYIGIDTPERNETFYGQATITNQNLVYLKTVTLIKDVSETDRYDRLLRYVFVDDTFVNYELVIQGYAQASTYPPDVACSEFLANAQRQAQTQGVGLWSPVPTPIPTAGDSRSGGSGNCSPAYPTVCIPPPPPDLDCKDISYKRFKVLPPDPHNFDRDGDGIGCES
jgi:micrococcal nuclease